jgi:predicted transcriptional regulator
MEVNFPPELEAKLAHSAAQQGRNPDDLVRDVLKRHFEEESRFIEAVKRGEEALKSGEYLTHEQVGERLRRRSGAALVEAMQSSPYKDVDLPSTRDR